MDEKEREGGREEERRGGRKRLPLPRAVGRPAYSLVPEREEGVSEKESEGRTERGRE